MKRKRTKWERLLDVLGILIIAAEVSLIVFVSRMPKGAAEAVLWQEYVVMSDEVIMVPMAEVE